MDSRLKQRLIGAVVLAMLAIIFLPLLLKGPDVKDPDAADVPLSMPTAPNQDFETRELPLNAPESSAPPGGVLGMNPAPKNAEQIESVPAANASVASVIASEIVVPTPTSQTPAVPVVPEPSAASVSASPAVVVGGAYAVNIGSFNNLDNAKALANKLKAAHLPVTTENVELNGKPALRVRVGPYADRTAAEAARLRVETATGNSGTIVTLDAVRIAGPSTTAKPATKPTSSTPTPAVPAISTAPATTSAALGFAVQLAAPSVEADAVQLRDRARALGFSAFVQRIETDSGVRFRVRVGPVADRSAAESLRDSVNQKLGTSGIVVPNP
jgi:cell division septation protein DedD